jgi:hypothetical protein
MTKAFEHLGPQQPAIFTEFVSSFFFTQQTSYFYVLYYSTQNYFTQLSLHFFLISCRLPKNFQTTNFLQVHIRQLNSVCTHKERHEITNCRKKRIRTAATQYIINFTRMEFLIAIAFTYSELSLPTLRSS